jgi:hypothetical protein
MNPNTESGLVSTMILEQLAEDARLSKIEDELYMKERSSDERSVNLNSFIGFGDGLVDAADV